MQASKFQLCTWLVARVGVVAEAALGPEKDVCDARKTPSTAMDWWMVETVCAPVQICHLDVQRILPKPAEPATEGNEGLLAIMAMHAPPCNPNQPLQKHC